MIDRKELVDKRMSDELKILEAEYLYCSPRKSMVVEVQKSLFFDATYYIAILDKFVQTGIIDDITPQSDYLTQYILEVLHDPFVRMNVFSDEVKSRIFYDNMLMFLQQIIWRHQYRMNCAQGQQRSMNQARQWSLKKRQHGWRRLIDEISQEYQAYGFDSRFYRSEFEKEGRLADDNVWNKMIEDWTQAFNRRKEKQIAYDVDRSKEMIDNRMRANLSQIPEYLQKNKIKNDVFLQVWGVMGGMWNTIMFEQYAKIVRLQEKYPELEAVACKMGRVSDDDSNERIPMSVGGVYKMEHSSKCDILGVTLSKSIDSLLPLELVQCCDNELHKLFLYKYATHNLQSFRYKSEIVKPMRRITPRPARLRGPMIVCVDKSGSMSGTPEDLAHSLMLKLLSIADKQRRELYLISFSVEAIPIDVRKERAKLLDFFKMQAAGDTNATKMLQQIFEVLSSNVRYMSADVLWISDFRIPLTKRDLRERLLKYRREGTRFYGLQIGMNPTNEWSDYFDEIINLKLQTFMRPYRTN